MKKFLRFFSIIIFILILIGLIYGIWISIRGKKSNKDIIEKQVFSMVQNHEANVSEFFTYGRSLNITCTLSNISKDNLEGAKFIVTDGMDFTQEYKAYTKFDDNNELIITTSDYINDAINLDKLDCGNYYLMVRLKLNNSSNHKYYLLKNNSKYSNIEYFSVTSQGKNKRAFMEELKYEKNDFNHSYFTVKVEETSLPENVYDIVIDAAHGGNSSGEVYNGNKESEITLDYAKSLKSELEKRGLKVKLTRDDTNSEQMNEKNTYGENGRISVACSSKAKYMISLNVNNGSEKFSGVEVYAPCKSNLKFAENLAKNIVEGTSIEYSNVGKYQKSDGVYVQNFTNNDIKAYENTAKKNGYENYNLNTDTPFLFIIREVGGIATNAYMDGRNKNYDANKYYNSNQGIECYQLEMGYIKTDIEKIINEKSQYINSIANAIENEIK